MMKSILSFAMLAAATSIGVNAAGSNIIMNAPSSSSSSAAPFIQQQWAQPALTTTQQFVTHDVQPFIAQQQQWAQSQSQPQSQWAIQQPAAQYVQTAITTTPTTLLPLAAAATTSSKSSSMAFTSVQQPVQMNAAQQLPTIELAPIMQTYAVPSQQLSQENIKQPITQPVMQPYLQRYVQQAQPIVQPIVNRVLQPVIHRQLHPYLTSQTEQGPAAFTVTQPTQYTLQTNQAIQGADLAAFAVENHAVVPAVPIVAQTQTYLAAASAAAPSKSSSAAFSSLPAPLAYSNAIAAPAAQLSLPVAASKSQL